MLLLSYTATFLPISVAFYDVDPPALTSFELFIDALFFIDVYVNMVSAYVDRNTGYIEVNFRKIAKNYLTSWFAIDLTASIPFQLFVKNTEAQVGTGGIHPKSAAMIRMVRMPRLYRLMRIMRLAKVIAILKSNDMLLKIFDSLKMSTGMVRMVKIIAVVLFIVHLMSCLWFLSAKMSDMEPNCWVVVRGI